MVASSIKEVKSLGQEKGPIFLIWPLSAQRPF